MQGECPSRRPRSRSGAAPGPGTREVLAGPSAQWPPPFVAVMAPNSPCDSSPGPAVNSSVCGVPIMPFPNSSAHRPSISRRGPRLPLRSAPSKWPFFGSNALMRPLPKLPIRRSLLAFPKCFGACAMPHGALSGAARDEPLDQVPARVVDVDETEAGAVHVVLGVGVLLGVRRRRC